MMSKPKNIFNQVLAKITKAFKIRISQPKHFIGMEIQRDRKKKLLKIHQTAYIKRILERYGRTDANLNVIPLVDSK